MLHCYIIITCSERTQPDAVRTPHSTQFFRLVQRGGCKTSWEVLFTELCTSMSLSRINKEENLHSGDQLQTQKTYHRCQREREKTNKKKDNK